MAETNNFINPPPPNKQSKSTFSKYHDALLEVQSQLHKIVAEFNIEFPENYPATHTIRKDLETLRHYGILDKRMYRFGYYLGTGAMNREELLFAFQAIASQAKYQGNPQARQICAKLTNIMSGRATAIFVGEGSPTIPANNGQSQKPALTGILWLIERT